MRKAAKYFWISTNKKGPKIVLSRKPNREHLKKHDFIRVVDEQTLFEMQKQLNNLRREAKAVSQGVIEFEKKTEAFHEFIKQAFVAAANEFREFATSEIASLLGEALEQGEDAECMKQ